MEEKHELDDQQDWCCREFANRLVEDSAPRYHSPPVVFISHYYSNPDSPPRLGIPDFEIGYSGDLDGETIPISYCPWCGEVVGLSESDRVVEIEEERTIEKTVQTTETETKHVSEEEWRAQNE